jgi:hypothetical protein
MITCGHLAKHGAPALCGRSTYDHLLFWCWQFLWKLKFLLCHVFIRNAGHLLVWGVLGVELGALSLLGRRFTTWDTPLALFALVIFETESPIYAQASLDSDFSIYGPHVPGMTGTLHNDQLFFSFIHMCIQCLGHFSPLPPTPSLTPLTPCYPAETILPISLILLKREYKQ